MFPWILCFLPFGWATASDGQWLPELETATALQATTTPAVFSDNFLSSRSLEATARDPDTDGQMSGTVIAGIVVASWIGLSACCFCTSLLGAYADGDNGDFKHMVRCDPSGSGDWCMVAFTFCFFLWWPLTIPVAMCCVCYDNMSKKSQAQASEDPELQASRAPRPPSNPKSTSGPELPRLLGAASKAPSVPAPVAPSESQASKPASAPAPAAAQIVIVTGESPASKPAVLLSGRISAQWPRGKVANFTIQATGSFEAFGHQYTLDPQAPLRRDSKFRWPDGTVQTVDRQDRNTIWWRTNHPNPFHPNPEWQCFQWVCSLAEK